MAAMKHILVPTDFSAARHAKTDGLLRQGNPAPEIVDAIRAHGIDLVVMGTHGRHGLPRLLLGSVAEKVVRTSPVPVMTVSAQRAEDAA
jgi:nucleotide-binding universal stress UspA family protein